MRHRDVAALYVAEAGVAYAKAELSRDSAWGPQSLTQTMPNGRGSYTISFATASPGPNDSVNNLTGPGVVDGPRGPGTVPPFTADLVVLAELNGRTRRLEVILSNGGGGPPDVDVPLLASRGIRLNGNVVVKGIESLADPQPV